MNNDRIRRSNTVNLGTQNNQKSVHLNPQRMAHNSSPQYIKNPYAQDNNASRSNHEQNFKTHSPQIKRHNTSPNLRINQPVIRSNTKAQNPNNMKKYDININIKDFEIKSMNNQNVSTTYAQQQQYNQNYANMFDNNLKSFIFYGPNKQKDLIYVGQNPVLKNYFKLRRLKYDELVENLNKGDPLGFNTNIKTNDSIKREDDNDGFIKVNVSGNIRIDNPDMYKQRVQHENATPEKNHITQDKKVSLKKKMFGLFKSKPLVDEKRNDVNTLKVDTARNNSTIDKNNGKSGKVSNQNGGIQHQMNNGTDQNLSYKNVPPQMHNKSLPQQPIYNRPAQQQPMPIRTAQQQPMPIRPAQQQPMHIRTAQQQPMPNRRIKHPLQMQPNVSTESNSRSTNPKNTGRYQQADNNYKNMQPKNFNSNSNNQKRIFQTPIINTNYQLNENRNSLKDVDMLLDVALKTYDVSDVNNKLVKSNLSPNTSLSTSPTKSDSWSNLLNAQLMLQSESYDDDFDFLELYSPVDIKKSGNQSRRISICSTNSENSIISKNSYRNLSFTNLEKLKVLVKMNEDGYSIRNEENKSVQFEDPVLDRLFESGFKEIKVFDKVRQKWVIYKDTNKAKDRDIPHSSKIKFSQSIEVFPLPPLVQDIDSDTDDSVDSLDSDNFSDLSEEDLMKLKSMKELQMFQEIKTEVNNYKSQEMLVHKDSILNTHFFI